MGLWVDVGVTYAVFLPLAFGLAWWTGIGPVALFALAKLSDLGKAATAFWWLSKERWVRNLARQPSGSECPASSQAAPATPGGSRGLD
jgi:Na+-driven multidrug efflux pump